MREELTPGGKQFLFAIVWALALYVLCGMGMSLLKNYAFIGGIISVIVFSVFGFFILTHFTARFTYTLKDGRLRVNRMIGKRNKEVDIELLRVVNTAYGVRPVDFPKNPYVMRISIFSTKKSMYIEYTDKNDEIHGLVIEPSDKLKKRIERERIKVENG